MRAHFYSLPIVGLALFGCQQSVTPAPLRSLAGSGRVSLLCLEATTGQGRDIRACPDSDDAAADGEDRHTLALVTQTIRGEVAAIDLHAEEIVDEDPWIPGTEFLPVGADPRAIVSTPGGIATFVAVAKAGLEAVYALPTTCITAPNEKKDRARDITLWPACRLPGRPGEMAIVMDATSDTLGFRRSCPASAAALAIAAGTATNDAKWWDAAARAENADIESNNCPADLALEEQIAPPGRRKLLVTLPDMGMIAIYDAQAILNLGAGSFQDCIPDSIVALTKNFPSTPVLQPLPADLQSKDETGQLQTVRTYAPDLFSKSVIGDPQPAGIAVSEGKLYVADLNVPLIHVVDVSDPCNAHEDGERSLRPLSFDSPGQAVYTREVSVSSQTLAGATTKQRFLYAIEKNDRSSAMVFDLSEGASRAPIVRSHAGQIPFEPPDRIRFDSPISKLQLVTHDAPTVDPATATAEVGTLCDPYPESESAGTLYRTSADYTEGAGPRKLRGIFGVMALDSGVLSAIDIEDWDAPCRRPRANNPAVTGTDWLGCQHDATLGTGNFESGDEASVTDESSCNVIEPHRMRSGTYFRTDSTLGVRAPSLSNFPRLSSLESGDLPTGTGDTERKHPQMLAVPFNEPVEDGGESVDAFLNVGTTRYELTTGQERYRLVLDPALAEKNSLILPLSEPRAYGSQEEFTATFEGTVIAERTSGLLPEYPDGNAGPGFDRPIQPGEILLRDPDAWFCSQGVEDYYTALETGKRMVLTSDDKTEARLERFAQIHADFVVLTGEFAESDPYFKSGGSVDQCGEVKADGKDLRERCESLFGTKKEPKHREFIIRVAQADDLLIVPRDLDNLADAETLVKQVHCCFPPTAHRYEVRAGNQWVVRGNSLYHKMTGTPESACRTDGDIRRSKMRGRAFEIASRTKCAPAKSAGDALENCGIGPQVEDDLCVVDQPFGASPASAFGTTLPAECLYDSLKGRFAIYRGQEPSERDMTFRWVVTGGFSGLASTIASSSAGLSVVPVDMVYSESLGALVIVDGASGGLSLVGMTTFAPLRQPFL